MDIHEVCFNFFNLLPLNFRSYDEVSENIFDYRSQALKDLPASTYRPGKELPPLDFEKLKQDIVENHPEVTNVFKAFSQMRNIKCLLLLWVDWKKCQTFLSKTFLR